jgi:hypothetical protein
VKNISENIWFTRKARIQASERLSCNDNHSQFLLVIYSIINTCLGVMSIKKITFLGDNTDLILVIMSVIILVTSLVVANKNFKGRSLTLKAHYIELQRLYFEATDAEENENKEKIKVIREEYTKLLDIVENHVPIDDVVFRVFNAKRLDSRKPTNQEIIMAYYYKIKRFCLLTTLYFLPIILIFIATVV